MSAFDAVLAELERSGLLLLSDAKLPSLVALVAGAPVRGSWWSHPRAGEIFRVSERLAEHQDVTRSRMVSGKVTYVHRRLWPALLAVGASGEPWQLDDLSPEARSLSRRVAAEGSVRSDAAAARGDTVRELERRLLIRSREVHTDRGAHAKALESWNHWRERVGLNDPIPSAGAARALFEEIVSGWTERLGGRARLPWRE